MLLLITPVFTWGLVAAFGWWALFAVMGLVLCTFLFSMASGGHVDEQEGAFGKPTTRMGLL